MLAGADAPIELFHGYTYSGHPLACAAGMAALDTYQDEGLFERAASLAPVWEDAVHSLRDARHMIDIRNFGLVAGLELAPRPGAPTARAQEAFKACFDQGLLIRVTGDIIALSPPLIVEERQIAQMMDIIRNVLAAIA
jgi:beta-alanine--pyruvate transaminase